MENARAQVVADRSALLRQVESVERSIVFLRQEQLTLLHGLHLEILSLQKRCTELTHELNVKPQGRSEVEVLEEEEQLEARCRDAELKLEEQEHSQGELRLQLSHKGALVGALRASLKEKERRFLEELKRRSHRTTALNAELQNQTETAAYLSFQLHSAKQKLQLQQLQRRTALSPQAEGLSAIKPKRRGAGGVGCGGGGGPKTPSQLRAERARECVPRERVTGPEEPTTMPDPALFLHPRRHGFRGRQNRRRPKEGREEEEEEEADKAEEQGASASRLVATAHVATTATATESKAE